MPTLLHSVLRTPHSVLRIRYSALRTPYSEWARAVEPQGSSASRIRNLEGSLPSFHSLSAGKPAREDWERPLAPEKAVVEGAQRDRIRRGLGGDMRQAGLPGTRPRRRGEQQLPLGLVGEGAREEAIDPLMPLALRTEGTQPE